MTAPASPSPAHESITVVGVGLIGGSIAAALRRRNLAKTIVGIGRSAERLQKARDAGIVDVAATDIAAAGGSSLVIVCTPVDRIVEDVRRVAEHLAPGTIITDAGSVKAAICRELKTVPADGVSFVGAHPLAGSEKSGWERADADLFEGRVCVVTPKETTPEEAIEPVEAFWQSLGLRTVRMSPEEHDSILALTSHLPHVAAAALSTLLSGPHCDFAAGGFRDTTRVAAGAPQLWAPILRMNAEKLAGNIDLLIERLQMFRDALAKEPPHDSPDGLLGLLEWAKTQRDALDGPG